MFCELWIKPSPVCLGGNTQKGAEPSLQGESRGEAPRWLEASNETWVSWWGYPKGAGPPLAHDLAVQGLVCYTFCGGRRRKGLATGQRTDLSAPQDRRDLQAGWPKTQGLVKSKARLSVRDCVRLDGAKRKKSVRSRAAGGI